MDFMTLKPLLRTLVLPPTGPLIVAVFGLTLLQFTRARRTGVALCAAGLTALWLCATPIFADWLTRGAELYPALDLNQVPQADAIVILAGGVRVDAPEYGGSAPSMTTLLRLSYGAQVARATKLPVLVTGNGPEAQAMSESLQRDFGVTVKWVENHSHDTQQNAQLSAAILKDARLSRIVLVTSASHMKRAAAEFRALGVSVVPAPTDLWRAEEPGFGQWVPSSDSLRRSYEALYEDLGNLVLAVRSARH